MQPLFCEYSIIGANTSAFVIYQAAVSTLYKLTYLIFLTTLEGMQLYYPHFTNEKYLVWKN